MNPDSPAEIRALLQERGLSLKKRWGQNFLVNRGARERLVSLLAPEPQETIWEIGPGLGSMTADLVDRARIAAVATSDSELEREKGCTPRAIDGIVSGPPNFQDMDLKQFEIALETNRDFKSIQEVSKTKVTQFGETVTQFELTASERK